MTDDEFRAWLSFDHEQRCVLVELDYVDESEDSPAEPILRTLYLSDREFFDDVTDIPYVDVVRAAPQYSRSLSGDRLGSYNSTVGTLELDNADGELDFMLSLAVDGSSIRFYYGRQNWPVADFKLIFSAITSKVSAPTYDRISVTLKDTGLLLNKSVGGDWEVGSGPNAGRSRSANLGFIHNLQPLVIDETIDGGKYAHTDTIADTAAVEVRDRGVSVAFTDDGDGTFRLTVPPAGAVTCDVLVDGFFGIINNYRVSDHYAYWAGIRAGLALLSPSLYFGAGPTFTIGDVDDYLLGVSLPEARNVIEVLGEINDSGNSFWAVKRTGEFTFGRLRLNDIADLMADSPPAIEAVDILEDDIDQGSFRLDHAPTQYYRYQAYMSRNWSRQTDFATSLTPDERAVYERQGLFLLQPASVGTSYEDAPELDHKTLEISPVIDTLLSEPFSITDLDSLAQWMVTRRAMFLPWIEIVSITVGIDFYQLELGDPVRLFQPRFGTDNGVLFQVISNTIRLTDAKIDLRLARRNVIQAVPDIWRRTAAAHLTGLQATVLQGLLTPTSLRALLTGQVLTGQQGMLNAGFSGSGMLIGQDATVQQGLLTPSGLHPDVLLYVTMLGGDYTDHSVYAHPATPTDFVASGDYMLIEHHTTDGTGPNFVNRVTYSAPGGSSAFNIAVNDLFTIEGFAKVDQTENNTAPCVIFRWETGSNIVPDRPELKLYGETPSCKLSYDDYSFGIEATSSASLPTATLFHWAWTYDGTTDTHKWYINGVQFITYMRALGPKLDNLGFVWIGGDNNLGGFGTNRDLRVYLGETRMVRRLLYTSAFTPPNPYDLIPIT